MSKTNVSPLNKMVAIRQNVEAAAKEKVAIRISRKEIERGWLTGFVAATGSNFFVIELISSAIYLDGFVCLRFEDVSSTEYPTPHWSFVEAALSLRGQQISDDLAVDCTAISTLLKSIPATAGLVAVHVEKVDSGTCYIGKIANLDEESATLDTISPDATWDEEQIAFKLADITRVDFGGAYEDALLRVQISTQ